MLKDGNTSELGVEGSIRSRESTSSSGEKGEMVSLVYFLTYSPVHAPDGLKTKGRGAYLVHTEDGMMKAANQCKITMVVQYMNGTIPANANELSIFYKSSRNSKSAWEKVKISSIKLLPMILNCGVHASSV